MPAIIASSARGTSVEAIPMIRTSTMAALALAYFSNLNAAMTHYGTGSAPVFFGAGYVRQGEWWRLGFLISLVNLTIWLGIGPLWWKLVGIW